MNNLMTTGYWTKAKQEAAKAGEIYSKAGPIHTYEHDMGTASVGAQLFNRGTASEIFSKWVIQPKLYLEQRLDLILVRLLQRVLLKSIYKGGKN